MDKTGSFSYNQRWEGRSHFFVRGGYPMNGVVVVGTQWGDEGKGKVTDFLAERADVIVRYQGGNNAGHTIVFDDRTFALHLIPSGVFRPDAKNVMANGMVIDPKAFLEELAMLQEGGIQDIQLFVSDRAHVVMPYHRTLDRLMEDLKPEEDKVGTTGRGIGPAYTDKTSRIGIRMCDLVNEERFARRLRANVTYYNHIFAAFDLPLMQFEPLFEEYLQYARRIRPYVADTSILLNQWLEEGKRVLFEGAQGALLCLDHGTYPFVTSSSPTAASVPLNTGISPSYITDVVGVTKAYSTRVGSGYFATEFTSDIADRIRRIGKEYGTTTGRPRRIGWLDTVVLRHTKRVSGLTGLSVMLLDVLTGLDELKICVAYELDGRRIDRIPASIEEYNRCLPIYETMQGWQEDITSATTLEDLPPAAQHYLKRIEAWTNTPVVMFSVGPDRTQTIVLQKIL
jgi:adenylosuccinate synthase